MTHIANEKQVAAFNKVVKSINEAKKIGLRFYGLSAYLVAYTKEADKYVDDNNLILNCGEGNVIPHLSSKLLNDSGADDYPQYKSKEDEEKFS